MAAKKTTTKKTTTKKASPAKKTASAKTAGGKQTPDKKPATKPAAKKATPTENKKMSALDAAAKVLSESKEPMRAKEMIDAMAAKKYWTSPGGKTPHATLYAAILREINTKGKDARFKKMERGLFAKN